MNGAIEFLIVLLLLIVAIGELLVFCAALPVLRRAINHAAMLQAKLEIEAQKAIPAGIFKPIQRGDGTVALFPVEDEPEQLGHSEDAEEWLTKMGL